MDSTTHIDASKAWIDFFKILDNVYFNDRSFLINKAGIPVAEISKPKPKLARKNILEFAGVWSDIDNNRVINSIYTARKDGEKSKRQLPDLL